MPSAPGPSARGLRSHTDRPPLGAPLLLLNLKAYPGSLGEDALRIGRMLERLAGEAHVPAAIAPSAPDLGRLAGSLSIPVVAQHADPANAGARTGHLVAEAIRACGAVGSLVNHSERPLGEEEIGVVVRRLEEVDLVPVICAQDVAQAERLARFRPPYLAVEPPELIGGDRSVSTTRPEIVSGAVAAVRSVSAGSRVLCGAGIRSARDVELALELGSEGILVSSAVTRADDPEHALRELLRGFGARR
ncbi:MAG: triose-phosphate isomerase [Thermoplasmata archaeon]|nr:triose-phosphate isomerase [Thermoplasmata archaeon]